MNFFQAQDHARRTTWRLAGLFIAAIVTLVVLTNVLVAGVYVWMNNYAYTQPFNLLELLRTIPAENWALISIGVVGLIGVASLYKYQLIRGGGRTVAESLGGLLLTHNAANPGQRRLLNVVEEMAIAAGVAVPPVYLIPEPSINAFAAGFSPDDAVIGINQGTIEFLSRDELQGVVAHEFSHILNGDMRINLRLIATLHGIVFLSLIGYGILRGVGLSGGGRRNSNGGAPILALGVGLLVIGYSGTFFGNLIKAAVSRQREFLADASAVQFTRNPNGIADALKKIGALSVGSEISQPAAAEASHMFFGQVRHLFLNSIMSTHPPLEKRIRAIEPGWDGRFPKLTGAAVTDNDYSETTSQFAGAQVRRPVSVTSQDTAQNIVDAVGKLEEPGLEAARRLIHSTDQHLQDAAHDPWGCRALIYAMLLDEDPQMRDAQGQFLLDQAERGVPELTQNLSLLLRSLDAPHKLVLVEMAMPALKALSHAQYQRFMQNMIELIKSDRRISLFEWVLHQLVLKELRPHFEGPQHIRARHRSLRAVAEPVATLLSTLACSGHPQDTPAQERAFAAGAEMLDLKLKPSFYTDPNYVKLSGAIGTLRYLKPLVKPQLIKACAATVLADNHVSASEAALLQGIAAALDCPLPPSIYSLPSPSAPDQ